MLCNVLCNVCIVNNVEGVPQKYILNDFEATVKLKIILPTLIVIKGENGILNL